MDRPGHDQADALRVFVISDHYPPIYTGGYDIACHAVSERLRQRGCTIQVLTSNHRAGEAGPEAHVQRVLHRPQDSPNLATLGAWEARDHRLLRKAVKAWRPHVVSAWSLLQTFASLHRVLDELPVPVVYNLHDLWLPRHFADWSARTEAWEQPAAGGARRVAKRIARRWFSAIAPYVVKSGRVENLRIVHAVFCSRFRREQHEAAGLPIANSRVIYNGIDVSMFTGNPADASGPRLNLLFVGRVVPEKGLHVAVEALAAVIARGSVDAALTVVGIPSVPHDYGERIRQQIREAGLQERVTFIKPVPNEAMPELYRRHHALVFPSTGPEGFPITLLEAAACGLVLVGSATGGTGEFLVDGETGLTFPTGDAGQLAERLERLMHEPGLASRLATEAQQRVRTRFDIERIADETAVHLRAIAA